MKKNISHLITSIIALILWYGIFVFLSKETNPLEWNIVIKIMTLLIGISLINRHVDIDP
jgi:hypothetical protein